MEFNLETIVFYFLAAFITVFSILTVTTRRMVRSATYLLFVLFGTAQRLLGTASHEETAATDSALYRLWCTQAV